MGVVHLARRGEGDRVALKVLRPHIVGDEEARQRLAREVASLSRIRSRWVAEIVDADPWAEMPYVATRYVPGLSLHDQIVEEGPVTGRRPDLAGRLPGRGRRLGARRRRPAPRREAVQRADGGPHPDPHRLRAGPRRRRPQAHPHRLAARHPRLPGSRDPLRRGRVRGLRRALVGGDRRLRRHRPPAVRSRPLDGDHGPGAARPVRPRRAPVGLRDVVASALDPEPRHRPTLDQLLAWLRRQTTRPGAATTPTSGRCAARPLHGAARDRLTGRRRRADHRVGPEPTPWRSRPRAPRRCCTDDPRTDDHAPTSHVPALAERLRRASLLVAFALAAGAGCAAYPWLTATAPAAC